MINQELFTKAINLINNAKNVLITSHTRPDGDACGSVAAMCDALTTLGKKVNPIFVSPLPQWYEFLFDTKPPILGNDVTVEQLNAGFYEHCDLIIIIDTNSYIQLPLFDEWLKKTHKPVLVIDHHITSDNLGTVELVDTTAAAAGQIVLDLFRYAKWPISKKIANAFFVSLSTDTGWFRYSNTDSRAYRDAAELVEKGAEPPVIYRRMYQNYSLPRMKLLVAMLSTLELHFDNRLALQHLMWQDFEKTGSTGRDTENLIDDCQRISSVEVAALFVEQKDNKFRCSLRSKADVDVAKIAADLGGGGHKSAAGVTLAGPLDHAKKLIFDAVALQLEQSGGGQSTP
jgi:bifunctional oligoribonuclease and PAP phosphatase NrnA